MRKFNYLLFLFGYAPLLLNAQLKTKIDTTQIKIGEAINLYLEYEETLENPYRLNLSADTLAGGFEVLYTNKDTIEVDENRLKIRQHIRFSHYEPGRYDLKPIVFYSNKDSILSKSFKIKILDVKVDTVQQKPYPIKPIIQPEYTWVDYWNRYWLYIIVGTIILGLLIFALILWLRKAKNPFKKGKKPKSSFEQALLDLKLLDKKKYLEQDAQKPYYSELTRILRTYLSERFNYPTKGLLSEDFVELGQTHFDLSPAHLEIMKQFFYTADQVKFAKAAFPQEEAVRFRDWVEQVVIQTQPIQEIEATN